MTYRMAILGLGRISVGYDLAPAFQSEKKSRTHVKAIAKYMEDKKLEMEVYAFDPDEKMRERAKYHYPWLKVFSSIYEVLGTQYDLVLNCVPITALGTTNREIIELNLTKRLVVEKPGISSLKDNLDLEAYADNGGKLLITYPRRCLESTSKLTEILAALKEPPLSVKVRFSGDPLNIASHFVDLIHRTLGPIDIYEARTNGGRFEASGSIVGIQGSSIEIIQTALLNLNDHEITFVSDRIITYENGGSRIRVLKQDSEYSNFDELVFNFEEELEGMIENVVYDYLGWATEKKLSAQQASITSSAVSLFRSVESLQEHNG